MTLIKGLCDDLAEHCLARVPRAYHVNLCQVSKAWRELVTSASFYEKRKQEGLLEEWLYVLSSEDVSRDQCVPAVSPMRASSPSNAAATPSRSTGNEAEASMMEIATMTVGDEDSAAGTSDMSIPRPRRKEDWRVICRAFDAQLGAWSEVMLPEEVSRFAHGSRIAVMGDIPKLYVYGGVTISDNAETTAAVWSFDPKSGIWERAADMMVPRAIFGGGAIRDSQGRWRLYAAGGGNRAQQPPELSSAEVYHPEEDKWLPVEPMPTAKGMLEGLVFSGRLYLRDDGISEEAQKRALMEAYNPDSSAWEVPASENVAIGCPGNRGPCAGPLAVHQGQLYRVDPWDDHKLKVFVPSQRRGEAGAWVPVHGGLSVKDVLPPPFRPSEHGYQLVAVRGRLAVVTNSLVVVEVDLDLAPVVMWDPTTRSHVRVSGPSPPPFRVLNSGLKLAKARAADLGALQVMGL